MPAAAIAHFKAHTMPPKRFCTSPPPMMEARLRRSPTGFGVQLPPSLSPASSGTIPETQDAQPPTTPGVSVSDLPSERLLAHNALTSTATESTLAPGQRPVLALPTVTSHADDLHQQLCQVTQHLVGLATATARLPVLAPDKSFKDAINSISAAINTTPTHAEIERQLTKSLP